MTGSGLDHTAKHGTLPGRSARVGLRVSPGAAQSEIVGRYGESWKVRVRARAERGRGNEAVIDLLAETLAVPRARIDLVAGAGSRDKVVVVKGIAQDEAERMLAARQRKGDG